MEVKSSKVLNDIFRLEAKFYSTQTFATNEYYHGNDILEVGLYNSIYGINSEGIGYPVIRMNEFDGIFTGTPAMHSSKFSSEDFMLHQLKKDDVLICRTNGNPCLIGKSALVAKHYPYVYESHLFKIRPKRELINSATLVIFLNTKYGRMEIEKFSMQGNQANFSLSKFQELRIPRFSKEFCNSIEQLSYSSFSKLETSQQSYFQAENLLLDALDLTGFSPSSDNTNTKSFRESFGLSGRLDAEYYQPKFDELEAKIAATHGLVSLGSILTCNQRGTQPEYAEEGLPVINSKHVREGEVLLADNRLALPPDKENALVIQQGDVLINGTGVGTIGRSAPYLYAQNALPDNHVTVLRTDKLNPIFLSVYLNSIAGKYQVDKYFKGSSGQIELYPKDIDCFYVPLVDETIQTEIDVLVRRSFTLKAESERLLDAAKRAVEIAMEQDERAALEFLSGKEGGLQ